MAKGLTELLSFSIPASTCRRWRFLPGCHWGPADITDQSQPYYPPLVAVIKAGSVDRWAMIHYAMPTAVTTARPTEKERGTDRFRRTGEWTLSYHFSVLPLFEVDIGFLQTVRSPVFPASVGRWRSFPFLEMIPILCCHITKSW